MMMDQCFCITELLNGAIAVEATIFFCIFCDNSYGHEHVFVTVQTHLPDIPCKLLQQLLCITKIDISPQAVLTPITKEELYSY